MKPSSFFLYTFLFISITGCQFSQLKVDQEKKGLFNFQFDDSIPESFEQNLSSIFNIDNNNGDRKFLILIQDYTINRYDIYGGNSLRALEGEINIEISIKILGSKQKNKKLTAYKRFKSNELNPFAQDQMIESLESEMQRELIDEIIFEVSTFEM